MKKLLVTGSSGLIGSEVSVFFAEAGWKVYGVDNNQRSVFFGPSGDTRWNQKRLIEQLEMEERQTKKLLFLDREASRLNY